MLGSVSRGSEGKRKALSVVLSLALVGEGGIETSSVLSRGAVTSPLTGASLLAELGCSSPKLGVG